ncbi:WD40/YVTN/BNR-like repeat-containing protein [Paenibacillus thalictri]|nr:hypothetical protein [Paenibacillus thalictri]
MGAMSLAGCQEGSGKEAAKTTLSQTLTALSPDKKQGRSKDDQAKDTINNSAANDYSSSDAPSTGNLEQPLYLDGDNDWVIFDGTLLRSDHNGQQWEPVLVDNILSSDQLLSGYFSSPLTGWVFYWRDDKNKPSLVIAHTEPDYSMEGKITPWSTEALPTEEDWETSPDVAVHFFSYEYRPSYALLSSGPAAGQMMKSLYLSDDHGVNWKRLGNLTSMIKGYPTGISFRSSDVGWISCSIRGEERIQFYRTKDGGRTWSEQPLPFPEPFQGSGSYAETYAPVFDQENDHHGILFAEFVNDLGKTLVPYETQDGGETWIPKSPLPEEVKSPPIAGINFLEMNGWALSADGSTLYTINDINKGWQVIRPSRELQRASGMYFRGDGSGHVLMNGHELRTSDGGKTWLAP